MTKFDLKDLVAGSPPCKRGVTEGRGGNYKTPSAKGGLGKGESQYKQQKSRSSKRMLSLVRCLYESSLHRGIVVRHRTK